MCVIPTIQGKNALIHEKCLQVCAYDKALQACEVPSHQKDLVNLHMCVIPTIEWKNASSCVQTIDPFTLMRCQVTKKCNVNLKT